MPVPALQQLQWEIGEKRSPRTSSIFTREKKTFQGTSQAQVEEKRTSSGHSSLNLTCHGSHFSVNEIDGNDDGDSTDDTEAKQEGPTIGTVGTFELMSSKDLAYQMTIYDWELFNCVHEGL
ncbi:hypothetical protein P7K49_013970, partial [Saguinus oedipus]